MTYADGPVVLDTDIGTDVDDLLALLLLATAPEVELVGVTTVYGDVELRARLASRVLRLLGRTEVPVHAGTSQPRSGREVWWAGHEGRDLHDLSAERVSDIGGVDALLAAADRYAGELTVVAIGPLTNLGVAMARDASWSGKLRQLVVMGGEFVDRRPEHNVRSDVVAAAQVLAADVPTRFVGLDVTTTAWFTEHHLDEVAPSGGGALADLVRAQVGDWFAHIGQSRCHPHDPLAALSLLQPELFAFDRDGWRVAHDGEDLGVLRPDPASRSLERAVTVDVQAAERELVRRLAAAIAGS